MIFTQISYENDYFYPENNIHLCTIRQNIKVLEIN